jgi:hypothetical protein
VSVCVSTHLHSNELSHDSVLNQAELIWSLNNQLELMRGQRKVRPPKGKYPGACHTPEAFHFSLRVGFIIRKHANSQVYKLKQVAAIAVFQGFLMILYAAIWPASAVI